MNDITFRGARDEDVLSIVSVHMASFDGFFLSSLGSRFLREFYRGFIRVEEGILIVAEAPHGVVGFVGGTSDQAGFYSKLFHGRKRQFIFEAGIAAVRHPSAIPRLFRARRRSRGQLETLPGACLMTLGVSPGLEGKGIGKSLVRGFAQSLNSRGIGTYSLTTDADANDRTNGFYRSLGLRLERVVTTAEGRRLNEYVGTT
jgi:ribosomal protein S18 acetylase RimI-like enzyme